MDSKTPKHKSVWDWFYKCPYFKNLFFAFPDIDENGKLQGQVTITPDTIGTDEWVEEYTDGSGTKKYTFAVAQYVDISRIPNNTENVDILSAFEQIVEWVNEQNKKRNFPLFPPGCDIENIKAFPGQIAGQDETGAKFQFFTEIKYYIESEDY